MSYYTTGSTFSLKTGHFPKIVYSNAGITSSRSNGVVVSSDQQINGLSSTSFFLPLSNDIITAEQLFLTTEIETESTSTSTLNLNMLTSTLNLNMLLNLDTLLISSPFFIRIVSYTSGYIAIAMQTNKPFYINGTPLSLESTSLINSVDCSTDGTKIVGISHDNKSLYTSTTSGTLFSTIVLSDTSCSIIQVRMTRDGAYFTVLDANGKLYFYKTSDGTHSYIGGGSSGPFSTYPVANLLCCLSISSDGTSQFLFDRNGNIWILSVSVNLIGVSIVPVTSMIHVGSNPIMQGGLPVVWDSCACSDDGNKQIAVGFTNIGTVGIPIYACYIYTTSDKWATPVPVSYNIIRRNPTYVTTRASGTTSFMSSDGSKQWCIIDDSLYILHSSGFPSPSFIGVEFISYGTCNSTGDTVYLIDNVGVIWKSIDSGATFTKSI